LAAGLHYQKPDEYPGIKQWRLKDYAEPRSFIPFDFDGFADPDAFAATQQFLMQYRGFGYTTASHTPDAPRARAILEASRPVTRDECISVCLSLQREMSDFVGVGRIQFDESVYRGEQPIYTPVTDSVVFHFDGIVVSVEAHLAAFPIPATTTLSSRSQPVTNPFGNLVFQWPDKIKDGEGREDFIIRAAGHLRGKGLDQSLIERILLDYNAANISPPLEDDVVLDRARRYETADPVAAANESDWPEPEEVKASLPPVPAFNEKLLPLALRTWVSDIAERMQCPPDYLAVGALVAAGAVVGNRVGIQPKRHDTGWVEVPNLWGAIVGRPGVMKSPALNQVLGPLRRLERDALAAFTTTRAQFEIDRMQFDASKKHIEAQIKKGATILPSQLPVQPEEPQPPRFLLNDATYQKLGQVLGGNPHGLMVFQDEMSGLLMRLDSDGQEAARAFYLEAWNGQQSYTFDRIERGTVRIPRLCFSLLGGLQPSKLREYLRSAVYGGKGDDGLAQRLQMLVFPEIAPDWQQVDRLPDLVAANAADDVFTRLANLDPVALGARQHYLDSTPVFGFAGDAQDLFSEWWSALENGLRRNDHPPALESHISKYRKLVPALALLDHLIAGRTGDISLVSVKRAIAWQRFLLAHAKRAYAAVTSASMDSAQALSKHIQRGALGSGFTVREVYRHNWSLLSNVKEATEAVEVLVDLGWLRAVHDKRESGTDGRPSIRYCINPRLKAAA
jgi:hypothetical protein